MAGRTKKGTTRSIGGKVERGAGVVITQVAVGLCIAAVFAWGGAAFAGLDALLQGPSTSDPVTSVSWSLVVALYIGLIGVAASAGALVLGWLPVFALAHVAWLLAPPNRRWLSATIYPAPMLAFVAAAWLLPGAEVLRAPPAMALGLAFAAIPSLVLAAFHIWVLVPDDEAARQPARSLTLSASDPGHVAHVGVAVTGSADTLQLAPHPRR